MPQPIAHEINSPLQAVTLLLNELMDGYGSDQDLIEDLSILRDAYGSIQETIENLLGLCRPAGDKRELILINKVIEKTVALLESLLKKQAVRVHLRLSPKVTRVKFSEQEMGLVFLNLITNAVEAMSGISKSAGSRKKQVTQQKEITIRTWLRKDTVFATVADTGPGIYPADLDKIFDPFYTRKKKMGIGIGLSRCLQIVEDIGGSITAKCNPQERAVFTIRMPAK